MKFVHSCLFVILAILLITGCEPKKKSRKVIFDGKEMVFRFSNSQDPAVLDPSKATGVYENRILNALFEGLTRYGDEGKAFEMGVAEKYEVKDKGKLYIFHLRKNAKWSDDSPLTANDFVYAFRRILNPSTGAQYAYMLYPIKNAEAINRGKEKDFTKLQAFAKDNHTLEIHLNRSVPYFLELLTHYSFFPLHKATVEKHGDIWTKVGNIVGNGPFVLKERVLGDKLVMVKNSHYWEKDQIKLDKIISYTTKDQETQLRFFNGGETDWLCSPVSKGAYPKIIQDPHWVPAPYQGIFYFSFNVKKKPFDDIRVRKALSLALLRKQVVKVTGAGELPAYHFVPPGTANYKWCDYKVEENIEKAKKLLAEAGFPNGKGFPTFTLLYNSNEKNKIVCLAAQNMWKTRLNIEVKVENNEWKTYLDRLKKLNYEVIRRGWISDYDDAYNFLDMWLTGGGNNRTGWSSKEYDDLIKASEYELDKNKRREILRKAEHILLQKGPVVPIYYYVADQLVKPYVRGLYPRIQNNDHGATDIKNGKFNPGDNHPFRYIWIDKEAKKKYAQGG